MRHLSGAVFVGCAPGLEDLLLAELRGLGLGGTREAGGVTVATDAIGVHRICLECGLGAHVLVRVARFRAGSFAELERGAQRVPWDRWLSPGAPRTLRATARASRLYHTGAIVERITRAIDAQVGPAGDAADDGLVPAVMARLEKNACVLSLSVTGPPLHRRGYRLAAGKAPLREDLARALLLVSGWAPDMPLVDPLCGAGTIPIEAAMIARRLAPGRHRRFALERTPLFDAESFDALCREADARALPHAPAAIHASDRDAGAVRVTGENAERARVRDDLTVERAALLAAPGLRAGGAPIALVTDPPHGRRLGDSRGLRALYQSIGNVARALPGGSRVALAATDRRLALASGLPLSTAILTDHGGTKLRLMTAGPT